MLANNNYYQQDLRDLCPFVQNKLFVQRTAIQLLNIRF